MKLLRLTATFGCLAGESLTFGPGLTLIGAPNGGGKSTWCAFLRTMLYGLDTRQRDRKGAPADKNRYRPWNGAPMEGLLVCQHQGQIIELRRTSADGVPMGTFSARYQDSGLPVPGLTGENVGEILTGVSQEVFDRSVFLRQTGLAVSQSQELEKRIASLVSAGEEDVSWSQANDCLKTWLHRRRFHKSGAIPQLEEEADHLRQTMSQTLSLRRQLDQLHARADRLRQQKAQWDDRLAQETSKFQTDSQRRWAEAASQLDAAELQLQTLLARQEELAEESPEQMRQDLGEIRQDLTTRRHWMTGFVTFIVLLSLCAAFLYAAPRFLLPHFPGFPLQIPEIPLLFLAVPLALLFAFRGTNHHVAEGGGSLFAQIEEVEQGTHQQYYHAPQVAYLCRCNIIFPPADASSPTDETVLHGGHILRQACQECRAPYHDDHTVDKPLVQSYLQNACHPHSCSQQEDGHHNARNAEGIVHEPSRKAPAQLTQPVGSGQR